MAARGEAMTLSDPAPRLARPKISLFAKLQDAVRPEFAVDIYFPDPDDPVLGRGHCKVAGCGHLVQAHGLCGSHHDRWRRQGKPEIEHWLATAAPLASRRGLHLTDCFDLRPLPAQARLEVAYALQVRKDGRAAGPDRARVKAAIKLLAQTGARSVLERTPEGWSALASS